MNREFTWLEISRGALRHNAGTFRALIDRPCRLMGVVKSNAYGHGLAPVVKSLNGQVDWFGVANLDEAIELRSIDKTTPVLVLSYYQPDRWKEAVAKNIDLPITSLQQLTVLSRLARGGRRKVRCHIKLDVGTSRIGLLGTEVDQAIKLFKKTNELNLVGIFSHFADAENPDQKFTTIQNTLFIKYCEKIEHSLGPVRLKHIACTAAVLADKTTHHDMVRVGIGMYGIWPDEALRTKIVGRSDIKLTPALAWKTRLLMTKNLPSGTTIGYGRTVKLKRAARIGVLPIGYNEGYDRRFSNKAFVIIRGQRAPIIGRVCMNLSMIDLTSVKKASADDAVLLLGTEHGSARARGRGVLCPELSASLIDTIPYELTTRISNTLPRNIVA